MLGKELQNQISRFSSTLANIALNLYRTNRSWKQIVSMLIDMLLVCLALWLAFSIRYDAPLIDLAPHWHLFLILPMASACVFAGLGVYRWVIRTSNNRLTNSLIKGGIVSSFILLTLMYLFPPESGSPRSIFAIYGMLFTLFVVIYRHTWRWAFGVPNVDGSGERVAVYGAGEAGQQIVQLMKLDKSSKPVLFIDDDPSLSGSILAGFPVINSRNPEFAQRLEQDGITRVILAVPSVRGKQYAQIVNKLAGLKLPVQTLPDVSEIISGRASLDQLRDISEADLLGRLVVEPDIPLMRKCISGKVVLVTGGGGSIGSEICRQVVALNPARLIVLDQSEENLYHITEEIRALLGDQSSQRFKPVLGSVGSTAKLDHLFDTCHIQTVFHAAAYKHVPILEENPEEAIAVNIFGTLNVLDHAINSGVENFTLISSDKAVRPANTMGASKRFAEMILQAKAKMSHNTVICMVRFGNVLGSSGSVVPKFKQQIADGGPVTLTHKDITRYFMTIPEASMLVMQASSLAQGGEVFVLDMGEPVRIYDFAQSMIRLSGKTVRSTANPGGDIEIKEIGLRAGEKMFEELFVGDNFDRTQNSKIFVAQERDVEWAELKALLEASGRNKFGGTALREFVESVKSDALCDSHDNNAANEMTSESASGLANFETNTSRLVT